MKEVAQELRVRHYLREVRDIKEGDVIEAYLMGRSRCNPASRVPPRGKPLRPTLKI